MLTYGRLFAEFLGDLSLVRLSLLDQTTCVGLRYGLNYFMLRSFSWKALRKNFPIRGLKFSKSQISFLKQFPGFAWEIILVI